MTSRAAQYCLAGRRLENPDVQVHNTFSGLVHSFLEVQFRIWSIFISDKMQNEVPVRCKDIEAMKHHSDIFLLIQ